ncbi:MAG TPA: ribokinase [Pirellulales bacterium]|nr:ribokinase [Pirellulales bacterium]
MKGSRPRIVVVGSIGRDLVYRVEHLPRAGETVTGTDMRWFPGGKGANQAVAAVRLGADVTLVGRVGDDEHGAVIRAALVAAGIDDSALQTTSRCTSQVAIIAVDRQGQNTIAVVPGASARLSPADVGRFETVIAAADAVLVQLEVPVETSIAAIAAARRHGVVSIVDPAPVPSTPVPRELWNADIVNPNQTEAEAITGVAVPGPASAPVATDALRRLGARAVVLKLGEHGAYLCDGDREGVQVPSWPVAAIDVTAAGDAFTAALAIAWVEGRSPTDAVRFAAAAGALATTRLGAQPALPHRAEVDALVGPYLRRP